LSLGHYSEFPASKNDIARGMEFDSIWAWAKEREITPNVITSDFNIRKFASNYPGQFSQRLYTYDTYIRQIAGPQGAVRYNEETIDTRFFCCNRNRCRKYYP